MKSFVCYFLFLLITSTLSAEDSLQFFAYKEQVKDNFNENCILCTENCNYEATIAFTQHWKITYWINQAYLGRSLITAKRHFGSYEEMNDEEAKEYRQILKRYLPALKQTFGAVHFNVAYLMNQAYRPENCHPHPDPHFHWHVIPRYDSKRSFAGEVFEDPDFGNSFDFDRKHYLTGEFQQKAIAAIRESLDVTYVPLPNQLHN